MRFAIPCLIILAIWAWIGFCIYVQQDERKLVAKYSYQYRVREYEAMKAQPTQQGGTQHWWDDG